MSHDYSTYESPHRYWDPAARQEMSIVHDKSTGKLRHTDGEIQVESLLSIVRTGNSVMLLYNGHAGQTLMTSSISTAHDLELWLKAYVTLRVVQDLSTHYHDFKDLSVDKLSARVDCMYAQRCSSAGAYLIVECGRSRQRFDLRTTTVRQRFLQECLTSSTLF